MKVIGDSSIIICGIVRNCEYGLRRNIPVINKLCDMAKSYHVIMYENDSTDDTKQILREWEKSRPNIHITVNDFNTKTIPTKSNVNRFFSRARIEKMAFYRNKYLEYIEQKKLTADFIIIIDIDVDCFSLDGIIDSFEKYPQWDAVAANGYIYSPSAFFRKRYNDSYALVECGMEDIPQTEKSIKNKQYKWAFMKKGMPLLRVFSAFGGLAIYKFDAIKDCRYSAIDNDDKRVEVRCEHYSLYRQMKDKGFDKVFINPNMTIKYRPYFWDKIRRNKKTK